MEVEVEDRVLCKQEEKRINTSLFVFHSLKKKSFSHLHVVKS